MNEQLKVGERVRAWSSSGECSCICTLACDNEDTTFDLIESNGSELLRVGASRIVKLEHFELEVDEEVDLSPAVCKERGNKMFLQFKDYDASTYWYNKALFLLQKKSEFEEKIGSAVLVRKEGSVDFPSGIVSDAVVDEKWESKTSKFEVIYDLDSDGEESDISGNRIILLCNSSTDRDLQRSCYLNLARCSTKRKDFGWSVRFSSIAFAITRVVDCNYCNSAKDDSKWNKMMADALFLRGKALLSSWRPKLAKNDAKILEEFDESKARSFRREIDNFKVHRVKSNQKLAKDIAKWLDEAMCISENIKAGRGANDLCLDDIEDKDDDDEFYDAKEEL